MVGLIIVAAALPGAYFRMRYSSKLYAWQRDRAMTDRMSWYYHWLLTDGTRAKEVRLFDLGGVVRGWFVDLRQGLRRERLTLTAKRSAGDLASGALATLAVFGTFAFIAWKTIQGTITVSGMVAYYMAFQLGLSSLQTVMSGFASLYEDNLFLTQYHEFTALGAHRRGTGGAEAGPAAHARGHRVRRREFRLSRHRQRDGDRQRVVRHPAGRGGGAGGHRTARARPRSSSCSAASTTLRAAGSRSTAPPLDRVSA